MCSKVPVTSPHGKDVWGVEKCGKGCGRVYGVSGKCVGVWGKDVGSRLVEM